MPQQYREILVYYWGKLKPETRRKRIILSRVLFPVAQQPNEIWEKHKGTANSESFYSPGLIFILSQTEARVREWVSIYVWPRFHSVRFKDGVKGILATSKVRQHASQWYCLGIIIEEIWQHKSLTIKQRSSGNENVNPLILAQSKVHLEL